LIAVERARDIGLGILSALHNGWSVWFPTWTMHHEHGDALSELLVGLRGATDAVRRDKRAIALRASAGASGTIYRQDFTHGGNGWHPHRHEFRFFAGGDHELVEELLRHEFDVRSRHLDRNGYGAMSEQGFKVERISIDTAHEQLRTYLAQAAGHELASANTKWGHGRQRTPFQILHDAAISGDAGDAALIREYWHAIYRLTIIKWSRGLRAELLGDVPELTDQEAADYIGNGISVASIDGATWRKVREWTTPAGRPGPAALCAWAELRAWETDVDAVREFLSRKLREFELGDVVQAGPFNPPRTPDHHVQPHGGAL
jgi:hypothetical protein